MLIDSTYFNDKINIPNINSETEIGQELRDKLDRYIRTYEPKYFQKLFGVDFYALFLIGVNASEARMITLRDMLIDTDLLHSPIANYVFFYYANSNKEIAFGVRNEAGDYSLNGVDALVTVWNEMSERSYEVYDYIMKNRSVYPEFEQYFELNYINNYGI